MKKTKTILFTMGVFVSIVLTVTYFAGGDSGGPHFNSAKEITAITSYGATITSDQQMLMLL